MDDYCSATMGTNRCSTASRVLQLLSHARLDRLVVAMQYLPHFAGTMIIIPGDCADPWGHGVVGAGRPCVCLEASHRGRAPIMICVSVSHTAVHRTAHAQAVWEGSTKGASTTASSRTTTATVRNVGDAVEPVHGDTGRAVGGRLGLWQQCCSGNSFCRRLASRLSRGILELRTQLTTTTLLFLVRAASTARDLSPSRLRLNPQRSQLLLMPSWQLLMHSRSTVVPGRPVRSAAEPAGE